MISKNCLHPLEYRERHFVEGVYIFDCKACGHVLHAKDSWDGFRRSSLVNFLNLWRRLEPNREYLVGTLAGAINFTTEILLKYIKRFEGESINGKPKLLREQHYGISQVIDENGKVKIIYKPHPTVLKDTDPEEGEPWPYDFYFLDLISVRYPSKQFLNETLELEAQIEYRFMSPTEVFIGLKQDDSWLACVQQIIAGEGVKEFRLNASAINKYGKVDLGLIAFHKEQGKWVEDASDNVNLDLRTIKCACGNTLSLNNGLSKIKCECGMWYIVEDGKAYALKSEEAFCYDFNCDRAWYWPLRCPNCNGEASLEFESGRWLCTRCGLYVEPKHDYRLFRCVLTCGHEHIYSVHYLTNSIPLKCWTCGLEAKLPLHIKQAWRNLNYTIFDIPGNIRVNGEYFVRRNSWVIPIVLGGPLIVGLGLIIESYKGDACEI